MDAEVAPVRTTVVMRFKGEIEVVWEYADEPGKPPFAIPTLTHLQPGNVIPYNWKPVSIKVVQE